MSEPIEIPVRLPTPVGEIAVDLTTTDEVVPIEAVMPGAFELADAFISTSVKMVEEAGHTVQCRKGCSACCRQLVPVSPVEAMVLLDAFEALPAEQQERVKHRFVEVNERIRDEKLEGALKAVITDGGREGLGAYFGLQIACPFLEEGSCQVYDARPTACRELLVASDPKYCDKGASPDIQRIPLISEMSRALQQLSAMVWKDTPTRLPLVWSLDWARAQRSQRSVKAKGSDVVRGLLDLAGRQRQR